MEYDSDALIAAAAELVTIVRERVRSVLEANENASVAAIMAAIDWDQLVQEVYGPAVREAVGQVLQSTAEDLDTTVPSNNAFQVQVDQIVEAILNQAENFDGKIETYLSANIDAFRNSSDDPEALVILLSAVIGDWFPEFQWENDRGGVELAPQLLLARFRGVPVRKIWVTVDDDKVRDFHEFAHLQSRDRDGVFLLGNGESARFPRDPELTPRNYFGCRCWMELEFDRTSGLTASAGVEYLLEWLKVALNQENTQNTSKSDVKLNSMKSFLREGSDMSDSEILKEFGIELDGEETLVGEAAVEWLEANGFRVDIDLEGEIVISTKDGADRSAYKVVEVEALEATPTEELSEDCGCELTDSTDENEAVVADGTNGVTLRQEFNMGSISAEAVADAMKVLLDAEKPKEVKLEAIMATPDQLGAPWRGLLAVESNPTGDGRVLAAGSVTWEEGRPFPVMAMLRNADGGGGHAGAIVAARIDRVWRDGNEIWGEGFFESGDVGAEVSRLIREQVLTGLSVDLDNVVATFSEDNNGDPLTVIESANLRGVTITSFGAIQDAFIEILGHHDDDEQEQMPLVADGGVIPTIRVSTPFTFSETDEGLSLVASARATLDSAPLHPPAKWFEDPQLDKITPLEVTAEGRIWGVLAAEGSCHIGFPGKCVKFPEEKTFDYFHVGKTLCEDGTMVASGVITINGAHADLRANASESADHYNTLSIVANVRVYRTPGIGLVVAGAVSPHATPEQVSLLRGANISGDWRSISRQKRLVAILGVATGGFVKPQADDEYALVASGSYSWDFELDEPLAATGINMVRREVFPFATQRSERIVALEAQVAELQEFVNVLRAERLEGMQAQS